MGFLSGVNKSTIEEFLDPSYGKKAETFSEKERWDMKTWVDKELEKAKKDLALLKSGKKTEVIMWEDWTPQAISSKEEFIRLLERFNKKYEEIHAEAEARLAEARKKQKEEEKAEPWVDPDKQTPKKSEKPKIKKEETPTPQKAAPKTPVIEAPQEESTKATPDILSEQQYMLWEQWWSEEMWFWDEDENISNLWEHSIWILPSYSKWRWFGWLRAVWPEAEVQNSDMVDYNNRQQRLIELHEKLQNPKVKLLAHILQVWTDAALKQAEQQWTLWWLNDDKEKIKTWVDNVNNLFTKYLNEWETDENTINKLIEDIFTIIYKVEDNEEDIIDNIEDVKVVLDKTTSENLDNNKIKVFRLMAGWLMTDGNTAKVKELLANDILAIYPKIHEAILEIDSYENITVATVSEALWVNQSSEIGIITEELKKTWQEANIDAQARRKELTEEIKKHQPDLEWNRLTEAVNLAISNSADLWCQHILLEKAIWFISNNNPWEKEKLYSELDSFSQSASEWIWDNIWLIALSVVPMWAWFAAVWLASKVWAIALRSQKVAWLVARTWKVWVFTQNFGKWAVFYEWLNTANNFLYLEEWDDWLQLFKNGWNASEIIKMWLTWNMFALLGRMKIIPEWQTLSSVPKAELIANAGKVLWAEWAWFAWIDFAVENTIWEGRSWQELLEVFASWVIMSGTFRSVGAKFESVRARKFSEKWGKVDTPLHSKRLSQKEWNKYEYTNSKWEKIEITIEWNNVTYPAWTTGAQKAAIRREINNTLGRGKAQERHETILKQNLEKINPKQLYEKFRNSEWFKSRWIALREYSWTTFKDFWKIWWMQWIFTWVFVTSEIINTDSENWSELTWDILKVTLSTLFIWKIFKAWATIYKVWKDGSLLTLKWVKDTWKKIWKPVVVWWVSLLVLDWIDDKMKENKTK